jgi:DNA-binding phage protein
MGTVTPLRKVETPVRVPLPGGRTLVYHTYSFVDKDPVIEILRDAMERQRLTIHEVSMRSGVAMTTLWHWFYGKTARPKFATCQAVARAMGLDFRLLRPNR